MNLVLFEAGELPGWVAKEDVRVKHVLKVLRRGQGEEFDAGVVNGPLGKATVEVVDEGGMRLGFRVEREPARLPEVELIIGLPRPQTARDILRDATTLGVKRIRFVVTERVDRNYAGSSLWTSGEWRRHCVAGAAQAFDTRLPEVDWTATLEEAVEAVKASGGERWALDNYEATGPLGAEGQTGAVVLALGPERGWGAEDRRVLREGGFGLREMGTRVLRLETAVVAGLALLAVRR